MLFGLTVFAAAVTLVLTGAITGLFYAFSISVMRGLDAIKPEQAVAAMQSINRKILNPVFYASFMLPPVAGVITGVLLLSLGETRPAIMFFLAAAAYVVGSFAPTAIVNVPMNNALDAAGTPADTNEAGRIWSGYSPRWTRWNHLRGVGCVISLLLVGLGLLTWGG